MPKHHPSIYLALEELGRRASVETEPERAPMRFLDGLHPKQAAFVRDRSKQKAAVCGRRSGKSHGIAAWLLEGAEDSTHALSVYVGQSKGAARRILWTALREIDARYAMGLWFRELDGQLMVETANGHQIWCAGAKDIGQVDKFRGAKYRRVAIDEAQSYGKHLREMVEDVFQPALIDYDGELLLAGTPAPVPAGLFYEATTGDGGPQWSTHNWTVLDNPYVPHAEQTLREYREKYGWDENHPTYQREWLGRWVRDEGAVIYLYDPLRNRFDGELPDGRWTFGLGIDLGYEDSTAFVVVAYRAGHPELYVLHVEKRRHLIPSAVAGHVERLRHEWDITRIVADEGGFGKGYAEEMRQRYGIPVLAADKLKKRAAQESLSGDFRLGHVKLNPKRCDPLIDELLVLQWDLETGKEDERFENHAADALLYIHRALRPLYRPEIEPPKPGTPEWIAAEDKREREMVRLRSAAKAKRDWRTKGWRGVVR